MFLFKRISVAQIPGLVNLLRPGEDVTELLKLSPEQLLLRWVNFQLEKVGGIDIERETSYCGQYLYNVNNLYSEKAKKKGNNFLHNS